MWSSKCQPFCSYLIDGLVQEVTPLIAIVRELRLSCPIDGLVQERRNSIANALYLRLSCIRPSI